ncbi:MAG: sugar ABC transporter permease [Anaerolineae bacterium]
MAEQAQTVVQQRETRVGMTLQRRNAILGMLLVAPVVLTLVVLVVYPFFYAIWISFTDQMVGSQAKFVGLENYIYLFHQPVFWTTVWNTIVLVVAVQALKLVFGLGIALLLNQPLRGRWMWRGMVLLPWAMPAFVAYITWKLLYAPIAGAFNMILLDLGAQNYVDFLGTKELAMPSVIVATFWRGFPFWVISFLAALQTIPNELYEAAAIDGAGAWQRFRNITLPSLRHVILLVMLLSTIWTANSFENVWLMTQGGPSDATMTFPVLAYYSLQNLRLGEAASVSVAMLPVFATLAFVVIKLMQED